MSSYFVAIVFGACAFFMFCTIYLIVSDILKFQRSLKAITKLAQDVKSNHETRKTEIQSFLVDAVGYETGSADAEQTSELIYEKEVAFYKSTMKILQDKSFSSIENYSMYVESLLSPYYKLRNQSAAYGNAGSAPMMTNMQPQQTVQVGGDVVGATDPVQAQAVQEDTTTPATAAGNAEAQAGQTAEAAQPVAAAAAEGESGGEGGNTGSVAQGAAETDVTENTDKIEALEKSENEYREALENVFKAYMALFGKDSFNPEDLTREAIIKTVEEMIANDAKPVTDDISADGALLEQLKFEKVELMNKHDSAMKTLNVVYKEYAAAFGMDKGGDHELTLEQIRSLMGDDVSEEEGSTDGDAGAETAGESDSDNGSDESAA